MKTLKLLFSVVLIFAIVLACKKDAEEETPPVDAPVTVTKSSVSAKWDVQGDSDFTTFEFNESGTYVVVKSSPDKEITEDIILFGSYTIDGSLMILENFGTLKVKSLTDVQMTFAIKLLTETDYGDDLVANKSEELPATTNTQLLCRTWKLVTLNGDSVAGTQNELVMVFYSSGTYVVTYVDSDELEGGLAQWKWKDSAEDVMCYSWDGEPDCIDEIAVINQLTNSVLDISDPSYNYVLVPIVNEKSGQITSDLLSFPETVERVVTPMIFTR